MKRKEKSLPITLDLRFRFDLSLLLITSTYLAHCVISMSDSLTGNTALQTLRSIYSISQNALIKKIRN